MFLFNTNIYLGGHVLNDFQTVTYIQIWLKGHNMICRFYMLMITQDKYKYVTPQNVSLMFLNQNILHHRNTQKHSSYTQHTISRG